MGVIGVWGVIGGVERLLDGTLNDDDDDDDA